MAKDGVSKPRHRPRGQRHKPEAPAAPADEHPDLRDDLSHFPLASLRWRRDEGFFSSSQTMLSRDRAPRTAIVFVHGWGGSALATWEAFPSALRELREAADADVFFLDYPSTKTSVAVCAGEARELLLDLLRAPGKNLVNASLPDGTTPRSEGWRYARIWLVAHSMGAVVVRRALLDLDRAALGAPEAESLRLLFFAPAHRGSSLPHLVASGLGLEWLPGASLAGRALVTYYRSLADLEQGSTALNLLLEDSKAARERRKAARAADADLRAIVLHARDDKVVVQDRFDDDIEERPIAYRNHRSASKPDESYRRPIDELRKRL